MWVKVGTVGLLGRVTINFFAPPSSGRGRKERSDTLMRQIFILSLSLSLSCVLLFRYSAAAAA